MDQIKESNIIISESEATTLVYLLQRHLRNCDRILGENPYWPKERDTLARLLSQINYAFGDCSWLSADDQTDAIKSTSRIY